MESIQIELIDALLCPSKDRAAESHFASLNLPSRVHGLFLLLPQCQTTHAHNAARCMLICVLLRRDISALGGYCIQNREQAKEIVQMVEAILAPLLGLLDGPEAAVNRQISFVIAEVCSILSLMDDIRGKDAARAILISISDACSKAHIPSLNLLACVIQRASFAFKEHEEIIISIISSATQSLSSSPSLPATQGILQVMNNTSIASMASHSLSTKTLSNNPQERMMQLIHCQTMTMAETSHKKLTVDANSIPATIGKTCLPSILQIINGFVDERTVFQMQEVMQAFSHCASTCPSLLAGDINILYSVCRLLLSVASKTPDVSTRLAAIEALATLHMVSDVKIILCDHNAIQKFCIDGDPSNGIMGVVKICADIIICGVDDDLDAWATGEVALQEDTADWDEDDNAIFAESLFELFVQHGGGTQCLGTVLSVVETLLASQDWKHLRAALSMLEISLTAFPYSFAPHVPVAVEAALSLSSHPCVRVQYQAVQLLGSLCEADCASDDKNSALSRPNINVRHDFGQRILASITQLLSSSCIKIVSNACMSITSYCMGGDGNNTDAEIDKCLVLPFLGDVLTAIRNGPLSLDVNLNAAIYCRAFGAIVSIAGIVEEDFAQYYSNIMPGLLDCAYFGLEKDHNGQITGRGSSTFEAVSVRGSAIMAASIIGSSVSEIEGLFQSDAELLMKLILPFLEVSANDQTKTMISQDHLFGATARISGAMKAEFSPFLPSVLPHLLHVVQQEVEVSISEGNESTVCNQSEFDEDAGTETMTFSVPGMGIKKLVLNTTQIHEKVETSKSLSVLAMAMGASFGPYTSECLKSLIPLLKFKYSPEVRSSTSLAVTAIFESACQYAVSPECNLAATSIPNHSYTTILMTIVEQLRVEDADDIETLCSLSDAMRSVAYCAYDNKNETGVPVATLTVAASKKLVTEIISAFHACLLRRQSLIHVTCGGKLDQDQNAEYENLLDCESEFLTGLVDTIGYTLKSTKEAFAPIFDTIIVPFFGPLLHSSNNQDVKARFAAICLFDDCVEHCGVSAAIKHSPMLAAAISEGIQDADVEVREASVYGLAQIARRAPNSLHDNVASLIQHSMVFAKEGTIHSKEEIENVRIVENSASALAALTLFPHSPFQKVQSFPRAEILNSFIANLPIENDFDEAKICHDGLCDLIELGEVDISSNINRLLQIIGEIAAAVNDGDDMATNETISRFAAIVSDMQSRVEQSSIQQAYSTITEEAQEGVRLLMGA
eukprot:CAMPEP_0194100128 /NCGR_PEP_ID=MMETSP0150-20130528/1111_1 /TAXON_ID=122233 /ORGANISM="Chaetoceros debilis, Strain MM31A-1" /LENGTH=1242 /DNA_ID=CAMNT_0038786455 /DNA_START=30 /DNA_END=3758 /DNA_ORIENTATION=-